MWSSISRWRWNPKASLVDYWSVMAWRQMFGQPGDYCLWREPPTLPSDISLLRGMQGPTTPCRQAGLPVWMKSLRQKVKGPSLWRAQEWEFPVFPVPGNAALLKIGSPPFIQREGGGRERQTNSKLPKGLRENCFRSFNSWMDKTKKTVWTNAIVFTTWKFLPFSPKANVISLML